MLVADGTICEAIVSVPRRALEVLLQGGAVGPERVEAGVSVPRRALEVLLRDLTMADYNIGARRFQCPEGH